MAIISLSYPESRSVDIKEATAVPGEIMSSNIIIFLAARISVPGFIDDWLSAYNNLALNFSASSCAI